MQSGNSNISYQELIFERVNNTTALSNFSCGLDEIDEFIRKELFSYLRMGECQLYLVKEGDKVVAMFCLDKSSLHLSEVAKEKMHEGKKPMPSHNPESDDPYWWQTFYEAVEITYLAVDKSRQRHHIGSFIVEEIMKYVASLADYKGDFVTVRALQCNGYTAIPFYEKCGFALAEPKVADKNIFMYRIVMRQTV